MVSRARKTKVGELAAQKMRQCDLALSNIRRMGVGDIVSHLVHGNYVVIAADHGKQAPCAHVIASDFVDGKFVLRKKTITGANWSQWRIVSRHIDRKAWATKADA